MSDGYVVEVKPAVFGVTSLSRGDFDPVSNMSLSDEQFENEVYMEFSSHDDAREWINELLWGIRYLRKGRVLLVNAHPADASDVNAYLKFQPA